LPRPSTSAATRRRPTGDALGEALAHRADGDRDCGGQAALPALPNAESTAILIVVSRSASGLIAIEFFPPLWHWARFPVAAARP